MKYNMRLYARPLERETIREKHQKLIDGLQTIKNCWGLPSGSYPPPDIGRDISANFSLTKLLGKGIKGTVWYRYRGQLRDDSSCDDSIDLEFNPSRVNYKSLIETALPVYIEYFRPYWGFVGDEEFIYIDFDASRNFNHRNNILRIYPITYFDEELCHQAYNLSLKEVSTRLYEIVEKIIFITNGILIIANSTPIPLKEANKINSDLGRVLRDDIVEGTIRN